MTQHNFTLRPWQKDHVERMKELLADHLALGDTSKCGLGKTVCSSYITAEFNYPALVICPNGLQSKWRKHLETENVKIVDILNYEKLRGSRGKISHPWLEISRNESGKSEFEASAKLKRYINDGVFVIIDECQRVRNSKALQSRAVFAITRAVINSPSRIILISNTPCNIIDNAESMLRLTAIVRAKKMYNYDQTLKRYIYDSFGLDELIYYAYTINSSQTDLLVASHPPTSKSRIQNLIYKLYIKIIKPKLIISMAEPTEMEHKSLFYNRFYKLDPESVELLEKGYSLIKSYKKDGKNISLGMKGIGFVEKAKLNRLVEEINIIIQEKPRTKIIVGMCRKANMYALQGRLKKYNVFVANSDNPKERSEIVKAFQANNDVCQILISSSQVCGTGRDLDDLYGDRPRQIFIMPTYNYIDDYQLSNRACRLATTKSSSIVNYVYCGNSQKYPKERILINKLSKMKVHKETVNITNDIISKHDYIDWYEE